MSTAATRIIVCRRVPGSDVRMCWAAQRKPGCEQLHSPSQLRADLVTAHQKLDDAGIPHGEVTDLGDAGLAILSFSDPDGVHLELTAPLS